MTLTQKARSRRAILLDLIQEMPRTMRPEAFPSDNVVDFARRARDRRHTLQRAAYAGFASSRINTRAA